MAKSKDGATIEKTDVATQANSDAAGPVDVAAQLRRRELLELRIRWKIADETVKKAVEERKDLRSRIDALAAELN